MHNVYSLHIKINFKTPLVGISLTKQKGIYYNTMYSNNSAIMSSLAKFSGVC